MKYDICELRQTGRQREKKSRWIKRMRNNRNDKKGGGGESEMEQEERR